MSFPLCVCHRDDHAIYYSQGDQTLLAVRQPIILDSNRWAVKDGFGIAKVDPVLSEVQLSLAFIPGDHGKKCIYI
mgnify:CR=1 FL=1